MTSPAGFLNTIVTLSTFVGAFITISMMVEGLAGTIVTTGFGVSGVGVNTNFPFPGVPSVVSGLLVTVVSSLSSSLSTWQIVPLVVAPLTPGVVPLKIIRFQRCIRLIQQMLLYTYSRNDTY